MINAKQIVVVLIGNQDDETLLTQAVNPELPNAHSRVIPKPICDREHVYPSVMMEALSETLSSKEVWRYVALLQKSYFSSISEFRMAIQKYEAECRLGKRLLVRRIATGDCQPDYEPADDFDLGHDFAFGKREDINAILFDKQNGKYSIVNNS